MNEDNVKVQGTEESSAGSEKVPVPPMDIVGAWELCPLCKGNGGWDSYHAHGMHFSGSVVNLTGLPCERVTCTRCHGDKYVFRPVLPTTAKDPSSYPTRSE